MIIIFFFYHVLHCYIMPLFDQDNNTFWADNDFCQGCFACGMETGFRVYNTDPLKEKEKQGNHGRDDITHKEIVYYLLMYVVF